MPWRRQKNECPASWVNKMANRASEKDQPLPNVDGCCQIQCSGKRSPSLTSGGRPRRKFCMRSAPVLAVVKMLTISKHKGIQAMEVDARGENFEWSTESSVKRGGYESSRCSSLPGLKRTALPGVMVTSAPVRGLRPIPVFRGRTLNTPNPRNSMRSPDARAFLRLSKTVSTAASALLRGSPVFAIT
jgi:hypothetical protein